MLSKIKWFWQYYKKYPYVLAVLLLLTPVQRALQVMQPRLIQFAVDLMKEGKVPDNDMARRLAEFGQSQGFTVAGTFALAIILLGLTAGALYTFVQAHRAWMNLKLEWLFRQAAFAGVLGKGPDFFNRFRVGD